MHAFCIKIDYLKRVGSRAARPERSECKIGPSNCSATRTLDELSAGLEIVRADGCTTLLIDLIVDLGAAPALRMREAVVRALFCGQSTSSSSRDRFLDCTIFCFNSFTRIRCVRRASTSHLCCTASAVRFAL